MTEYRNARGRWSIDIADFVHPDGRKEPRIRKTSPVDSKEGAKRYEREIRNALQAGTYGKYAKSVDNVPTLEAYHADYLLFYKSNKRKQTGCYGLQRMFVKHLLPLFGPRRVDSFGAEDEMALKAHFANHSSSRYNQAAAAINGVIALFHRVKKLAGDPFKFARLKVDDVTKPFYEFDRYVRLLAAAKKIGIVSELVVLLGRDAGLRRSEMWGLEPRLCRMRERKLIVEQAETVIGKNRHMGKTKGRELRTLDMTPALHDCLTRYFKAHGQRQRIIALSSGEPFTQKTFAAFMRAIQTAADLEPTGEVHILRHTFCSHLAILGVPVVVIQKLAGHKQLQTTLGYMHLAPGDTKLGIDRLSTDPANFCGNPMATAAE